jgi:hypothetical protein
VQPQMASRFSRRVGFTVRFRTRSQGSGLIRCEAVVPPEFNISFQR